LITLGIILQWKGQLDEAIERFRLAESLDPQSTAADSRLYAIHFHPDYDARRIYEEHKQWNQQHVVGRTFLSAIQKRLAVHPRCLNIGYVSCAFRDHVQSYFTTPLFANHDQLAEMIERDEIDILVDLMLHMPGNRLPVFARRPAPVQVTWLGYPGTTGLETMDYRLSDPYLDPPGNSDAYHSEKTLRLPHSFWCYDPLSNELPAGAPPALSNGFVTFGSLNGFYKITDVTIRTWAKIFSMVRGSRLAMLSPPGDTRSRVRQIFQLHDVSSDRIEFGPRMSRADYLDSYRRLDLCLDPIPCPGHTTTLDALWMGVPVVTLAGATAISRGGLSILSNVGLTECVSHTPERYVELAISLGSDPSRLSALRTDLRQRMLISPLMNAPQFARDLEAAYRQMWQVWCDATPGLQ
jgi:predicted O-linked N-acetylglucosamine transferase (SPINDLY family)